MLDLTIRSEASFRSIEIPLVILLHQSIKFILMKMTRSQLLTMVWWLVLFGLFGSWINSLSWSFSWTSWLQLYLYPMRRQWTKNSKILTPTSLLWTGSIDLWLETHYQHLLTWSIKPNKEKPQLNPWREPSLNSSSSSDLKITRSRTRLRKAIASSLPWKRNSILSEATLIFSWKTSE